MPAFTDPDSAAAWLAAQPRANPAAMLDELLAQLEAFERLTTDARTRYKTLETLRKTLFVVSDACRQNEDKPLPLPPAERQEVNKLLRLWRTAATAYGRCLQAIAAGEAELADHAGFPSASAFSATVAHRLLFCLRLEQMNAHQARSEPAAGFWRLAHAAMAFAEPLASARLPVADRLLAETSESTVTGYYAMLLLMHLARPMTLTRKQWLSVRRWFVRWREQAEFALEAPAKRARLVIDRAADRPFLAKVPAGEDASLRWLIVDDILGKIRQRRERLAAGDSPEELNLGNLLSAEGCAELLDTLSGYLRRAPQDGALPAGESFPIHVFAGLEAIYRASGGASPEASAPLSPFGSRLGAEQLAVFGHLVRTRDETDSASLSDLWRIFERRDEPVLLRPAAARGARLHLRSLLALDMGEGASLALVSVTRLQATDEGALVVGAARLPGRLRAVLAVAREKPAGRESRHPGLVLENGGAKAELILPAGLPARALSLKFFDADDECAPLSSIVLERLIERGDDIERWQICPLKAD